MRFRSFALFSLFLCHVLAGPAAADYLMLKGGNDVRVVSKAKLGPNVSKLFSEINQDDDFAAFTVNVTADEAGTIRLMGSLKAAVDFSLASCKQRSKGKGGTCELYAVVVPRDYPKGIPFVDALSQSATRDFASYTRKVRSSGPGYAAFAYSNYGEWGWAYGSESKDAAVETATLQCESAVSAALANTTPQTRALARNNPTLTGCTIIDVRQK